VNDGSVRPEFIVEGEFFARLDSAATEQKNVAHDFANPKVRVAAVVDALGSASSDFPVDIPVPAQAKHVARHATLAIEDSSQPLAHLRPAKKPSRVLNYLTPWRDALVGEDTPAVDPRSTDTQAKSGCIRGYRRAAMLRLFHGVEGQQSDAPHARQLCDALETVTPV